MLLLGVAQAHTLTTPRMVHVKVSADRVEVAVAWLIHAGPRAQHLRTRFDRNGDGVLGEDEQDLLAQWMQHRVEGALTVTLDGVRLRPEVGALNMSLARDAEADEEGLQFGSRAAVLLCLRPGPHELVIADRPDQPGHSVPLRVDIVGTVLGSSVEGEAVPLGQTKPGVLGGGGVTGNGGTITVRFEVPDPEAIPAPSSSPDPQTPPSR